MQTNNRLREALEELVANIEMRSSTFGLNVMVDTKTFLDAKAALAAPPRNCDVFSTKDTAREAFQKLRGHRVWAEVSLWDDRDEIEAFLDWLFALWKEGGAK